jgi:hypothetical protein
MCVISFRSYSHAYVFFTGTRVQYVHRFVIWPDGHAVLSEYHFLLHFNFIAVGSTQLRQLETLSASY